MPLYPCSKIGVIGGGQLGRMFILECRRMGYHSAVIDSDLHGPAAQVADRVFHTDYIHDFIKDCDVATYEFENVNVDLVKTVEKSVPVYPSSSILRIKQNKISEKTYLAENGFPVPDFWIFKDGSQLQTLIKKDPIIVKMSVGGYDGKGLYTIKTLQDYEDIKEELKDEIIAEKLINFVKEISVVCARNKKGDIVFFPVVENIHKGGILLYSIVPAKVDKSVEKKAKEIASELIKNLDLTGVMCVEMFLLENEDIFINEFAPRPHNSGHYTMDACDISQFEMLLRVICDLPVVKPELLCPAVMLNILGKGAGEINLQKILSLPGVKLHLYGKRDIREKRKMGHINITGSAAENVAEKFNFILKVVYNID